MKCRTSFVTNSSSTSFVFIANKFDEIIKIIEDFEIFGEISHSVIDNIKRFGEGALEQVFYNKDDIQKFIDDERHILKIDGRECYEICDSSISKELMKVLKGDVTIDIDNKVGMSIEVGDNHGFFRSWDAEQSAKRDISFYTGEHRGVLGYWVGNR